MKKLVQILIAFSLAIFTSFHLFAKNDDFVIDKKIITAVEKKYGIFAKNRVLALIKLMNSLKNAPEDEKLLKVNNFFNQVRYQSDFKTWGVKDYWATRMEFLGKDKGDCEDFATAKYFTLKQLNVPTSKMYLSYVKATKQKIAHMVLTYFKTKKSIPLVLDNYNKRILPATKRPDLIPVYSFNGDSLYLAKQKGLGKEVPSGVAKNKKWTKLLQDIKRNKI
ncbi:transglutaminase-like cysteine peptidase [Sulfurospirillum arcachonense]|uniref:transglutaminase-like cysteine peptidase n=1 Tax=Sulfurospirillum arcachonense TaxID=57666 RepID=UPI000467F35F|nr:transglutaminase-like cysteine peptidase [Sulfurospirillum arcachonense]